MAKISIIVPVYGAEKYLHRCLDSILAQTFEDWECILVDDGSKDRSGSICDDYSEKDNRFKVIHKENGGVSSARNCGIQEANGEWCCFIDSDDWVEANYLQNFLVDNYTEYGCIIQSFYFEYENNSKTEIITLPSEIIEQPSELAFFLEKTPVVHNGFIWHRLYKLNIIKENNIGFPVGISFAEDGVFFLNYILHTKIFCIISTLGYHYTVRSNSLTSEGKSLPAVKYYDTLEYISEATYKIMKKDNPNPDTCNGLKLYLWRLLFTWIICRSMKSRDDYHRNQTFLLQFFEKYPINCDIRTNSISLKYISALVDEPSSDFRYYALCGLRKSYFIEWKIRKLIIVIARVLK